MKNYKKLKSVFLHLSFSAIIFAFVSVSILAQETGKDGGSSTKKGSGQGQGIGNGNGNSNDDDSLDDMRTVMKLFEQKRFGEAVPYLERLVKANPNNADLHFLYGTALVIKSGEITDKTEARRMKVEARKALVRAKELGFKANGIDKIIAMLPTDGEDEGETTIGDTNRDSVTFSSNKDAQEYMVKGETFFAQKEFEKAFEMYEKALKKDPELYEAALFAGDSFLQIGKGFENNPSKQKENFDKAETWYQKAIIINPNRETAYRYSATPLMLTKQYDKARDRYIEAYITEPYNERALGGLKGWAEATETQIGHPIIEIPADVTSSGNGNTKITLGMSDDEDDGSIAWTAYALNRATWQSGKNGLSEKFKNAYPNEKTYRRSLAEEFDSMRSAVAVLKEKPVKKLNSNLATLVKLHDDEMLESYILLAVRDEEIARDQSAYLKQNRQKMRQYVIKYVVGNG
ncbi:MAG TPA: tetratricopeptide repeat protein [Pyrinomonadaceae bacterium]|nr:tetratricopeptide repeat protein [Pyrinomonadaceae bacterium]